MVSEDRSIAVAFAARRGWESPERLWWFAVFENCVVGRGGDSRPVRGVVLVACDVVDVPVDDGRTNPALILEEV